MCIFDQHTLRAPPTNTTLMNWNAFRWYLTDVFDLEPDSSAASRLTNQVIYLLIFVSTFGVILESVESLSAWHPYIKAFETAVMLVFLLEFLLRLLVLDKLYAQHRQTWERAVLTFYLLIDLCSILPPVLLLLYSDQHFDYFMSLRLLRLFKAFRHDHSVEFIIRAIIKKKQELLKSAILTFVLTLFLSVLLYEAENDFTAAGEHVSTHFKDIITTILWSFAAFVDEVSGFGEFKPVTPFGQLVGGLIGFMKIAIVVIPTGIIATGFLEVIEDDKRRAKYGLLTKAFRKRYNKILGIEVHEKPHTLLEIKNALSIHEQDLYQIAEERLSFRIRSSLSTQPQSTETNLIEFFGYGEMTHYGVRICQPESGLLIVSPDGLEYRSISYIAYCLAELLPAHLVADERFSKNSLNANFEYDFDNCAHYGWRCAEGPRGERRRRARLSMGERAFEDFQTDILTLIPKRRVILLQAKAIEPPFQLIKASQIEFKSKLVRWLLEQGSEVYALQIRKQKLDEAMDFELINEMKQAVRALEA